MTDEQRVKRNQRQQRWAASQDRLNFVMPRGYKARINAAAAARGISAAEFMRRAVDRELGTVPEVEPDEWDREMIECARVENNDDGVPVEDFAAELAATSWATMTSAEMIAAEDRLKPNDDTRASMLELESGGGVAYATASAMWEDLDSED